jgi:hypothetical protein
MTGARACTTRSRASGIDTGTAAHTAASVAAAGRLQKDERPEPRRCKQISVLERRIRTGVRVCVSNSALYGHSTCGVGAG